MGTSPLFGGREREEEETIVRSEWIETLKKR
jgi:hypothetical protein